MYQLNRIISEFRRPYGMTAFDESRALDKIISFLQFLYKSVYMLDTVLIIAVNCQYAFILLRKRIIYTHTQLSPLFAGAFFYKQCSYPKSL